MATNPAPEQKKETSTKTQASIGRIESWISINPTYKERLAKITSEQGFRDLRDEYFKETGKLLPYTYWDDLQEYHGHSTPQEVLTEERLLEEKKEKHKDEKHTGGHSGDHAKKPMEILEDKPSLADEREAYRKELREHAMLTSDQIDEEVKARFGTNISTNQHPQQDVPVDTNINESEQYRNELQSSPFFTPDEIDEEIQRRYGTSQVENEINTDEQTNQNYDVGKAIKDSEARFREIEDHVARYEAAEKRANELTGRLNKQDKASSSGGGDNFITRRVKGKLQSQIRSKLLGGEGEGGFLKNTFNNFFGKSGALGEGAAGGAEAAVGGAEAAGIGAAGAGGATAAAGGAAVGAAGAGVGAAGAAVPAAGAGIVYSAPVWIAIGILILFIFIFLLLILQPNSKPTQGQVTIFKTGPPQVPNPSDPNAQPDDKIIKYRLAVNMPAGTREIIVTDTLDDNAKFYSSTGPNPKFYDKDGVEVNLGQAGSEDKIKTIKWTAQGTSAGAPLQGGGSGTIANLGFGPSNGQRIDALIKSLGYGNSPMYGKGDLIVQLATEFKVDPLMIIVTVNESGMCTDNGVVSPGGSDPDNYNCGGITWDAASGTSGVDLTRWQASKGPVANGHAFTFVPNVDDGIGLFFNYIGVSSLYQGKTLTDFYNIYNPCNDPGNQGQFACGAAEAQKMIQLLQSNLGPASDGSNPQYQAATYYINWDLYVTPRSDNSWVLNQAYVNAVGSGIIGINAATLDQIFAITAQNARIPVALLKAIAKVETGGLVFEYTDQDVTNFSLRDWWVGLVDNAPTISGNDPLIVKGFAYNTCAYRTDCAAGSDVRGVMQFEIGTWNGIISKIPTIDGHTPDRRYIKDNIMGAGIFIGDYVRGKYPTIGSDNWTDEQVKYAATRYCGDPTASACMGAGLPYDEAVLKYYKEFLSQP